MIKAKTVTSIEELIAEIRNDYKAWDTKTYPWFRGEPRNTAYPVTPKIYRETKYNEKLLLQEFRRRAPSLGFMNTPQRGETDQWLFLAQHVSLPTRLLDWSEGLFIALYFALLEKKPSLWMLHPIGLNNKSTILEFPKEDNEFPLTWFSHSTRRVTASDIRLLNYEQNNDKELLDKQLIEYFPGEENELLRNALKNRIVNERLSLFHPTNFIPQIGNTNIHAAWVGNSNIGTEFPIAIFPTYVHSRMNAQKSCFTIHGRKEKPLSELVDE